MANPVSKGWKYLKASLDSKIEQNADPKIQIQQAIDEAKRQHQEITEQAAEIIGNKSRLEMQMNRLSEQAEGYQQQVKAALQKAAEALDGTVAAEYNRAAEVVASQLVAAETQLEDLKIQHRAAAQAAERAKMQQQHSEARLKEQLTEANQLMAQADQAKMQEQSAQALSSFDEMAPSDSTPTLDGVRAKLEKRYAEALGAQELAQAGSAHFDVNAATTDIKANARLEEIRAKMNKELES
ncbi:hypothetical protein CPHO_11805 [Corynebacterium phocae]|uniref:PspA/IM30 family protein n=1 Tax=Corynebacterium phocae TaxID=161895 RepID=A0A1L7D5Z2_9CORY|nr:PspA/IM30 family protein [Corynebacterium phocae]APT93461.1 hypothetical protein CPHO_11805 [Corynebacterium phocae]KAA8721021.1 PspA/IM30 family protein [Corynebacterium phocae]